MTDSPPLSIEVEAFLRDRAYTARTFPAIAAEAHRVFGDDAPSPGVIATYICRRLHGTQTLRRFERDIAVTLWLADEGWTATLDDIRARCTRRFGAARTPSRSSLARFLNKLGRTGVVVSRAIPDDIDAYMTRHASDLTLSDLTHVARKRFGARAPSRSRLHRHLRKRGVATAGRLGRVAQDDEIAAWFRAAAGTMTLDRLRATAIRRFGAARVPSRSAIHRFLTRLGTPRPRHATNYRPEVVAWLYRNAGAHSLDSLSIACAARFGADVTPSRSAIHRLVSKAPRVAP